MTPPSQRDPAGAFEEHRPLLTGVAYRILGSFADAEDVAQETWLRWPAVDSDDVRDPRAFLVFDTADGRVTTVRVQLDAAELTAVEGPDLPPGG